MRTQGRRGAWAVLLLAALAGPVLAGCAGTPEPPADVANYQPATPGGMEALLTGTLARHHGCTYVDDRTGQRWVPIFPAPGLAWDGDELHAGGAGYRLGTEVALPGGETDPYPRSLPRGCDPSARTWLVAWNESSPT